MASAFPSTFERDGEFFTVDGSFNPTADLSGTFSDVAVEGRALSRTGGQSVLQKGRLQVRAGRTYSCTARIRIQTDATNGYNPQPLVGLVAYTADGTYLGGAVWTAGFVTKSVADGWMTLGGTATTATILGTFPTAAFIRFYSEPCWNGSGTSNAVAQITQCNFADVTESTAAAGSATASASSASSASTSATNAGTSASAASTSATNAATQASNASTSASNASTSAGNAASSATTAATQASNAAGSASSASSSASSASASATAASNSATLSATFASGSQGSINSSATFADNANATGVPTNWDFWENSSGCTRVTGIAPQPYAVTIPGGAAINQGIRQYIGGRITQGWHVLEADVTLNSGSFIGAGVHLNWGPSGGINNSFNQTFASREDVTGVAPGSGTSGRLYKFRTLININTACDQSFLYCMSHWEGFGSIASANSITWHRCAIRAASQAEIEARQAKNDLVTTNANVASNTSAIATETSARAAADTVLTARANSAHTAGQNLLQNSTFINGGTSWITTGSPAYNTGAQENSYISMSAALYQNAYQDVRVEVGRRYSLSAELYRSNVSMSARVYILWLNEARNTDYGYGAIINHPGGTGWAAVKADLEGVHAGMIAPSGAAWARVYVDNYQPTTYPSGQETAIRRVCFNRGDYAEPWSEGPVEAALATTNANIATNASAIATETSARAAADTTLSAKINVNGNRFPHPQPLSTTLPAGWVGTGLEVGTWQPLGGHFYYRPRSSGGSATTEYYYYDVEPTASAWVSTGEQYTLSAVGYGGAGTAGDRLVMWLEYFNSGGTMVYQSPHVLLAAYAPPERYSTTAAYTSGGEYVRRRVVFAREWAASGSYQDTVFNYIKLERGPVATAYTADGALTPLQASVTTNASAIATVNGAAAFWETIVSAGGGDLSAVRLKAGSTGSYIELISTVLRLANVSNGAVIEVMRAISGEAYFSRPISSDSASRRLTIGPGYGVSGSEVVLWFGPVATAPSSQSRTNGYFALGTDGKIYFGSNDLAVLTTPMTATITGSVSTSHNTSVTPTVNTTVSVTGVTNATSPYTYQWALVGLDPGSVAPELTGVTASAVDVYRGATLATNADYGVYLSCTITDANGKQCVKHWSYVDVSTAS